MTSRAEALDAVCRCIRGLQALCDLLAEGDGPLTVEDMRDVALTTRAVRRTLRPLYKGLRVRRGVKVYGP